MKQMRLGKQSGEKTGFLFVLFVKHNFLGHGRIIGCSFPVPKQPFIFNVSHGAFLLHLGIQPF